MTTEQPTFRSQDPETTPISAFHRAEDVIEAMMQSVQGGEVHLRLPLQPSVGSPFLPFIEVGLALRACLEDKNRRNYLIERLKPYAGLIVGTLPPGILQQGLLPKSSTLACQQAFGLRQLEDISDEEVRQWLVADSGLVYGELTRYELDNYFDAVRPHLRPGGTMIDLGSGLGKVVMSAAVSLPFERCVGVELLAYRHQLALERLEQLLAIAKMGVASLPAPLSADAPLQLPGGASTSARHLLALRSRIELREQDLFHCDVSKASLIFVYSTCFGGIMDAISEKLARELPQHCLVSSTTYAINHPAFRLIQHYPAHTLAWTSVFLYERVGALEDLPPAEPSHRYDPDKHFWELAVRKQFEALDAAASC